MNDVRFINYHKMFGNHLFYDVGHIWDDRIIFISPCVQETIHCIMLNV